jgi:hypothetical protein
MGYIATCTVGREFFFAPGSGSYHHPSYVGVLFNDQGVVVHVWIRRDVFRHSLELFTKFLLRALGWRYIKDFAGPVSSTYLRIRD